MGTRSEYLSILPNWKGRKRKFKSVYAPHPLVSLYLLLMASSSLSLSYTSLSSKRKRRRGTQVWGTINESLNLFNIRKEVCSDIWLENFWNLHICWGLVCLNKTAESSLSCCQSGVQHVDILRSSVRCLSWLMNFEITRLVVCAVGAAD